MTITKITTSSEGHTILSGTVTDDGRDEQIAREFFEQLTSREIDAAVTDYNVRVTQSRAYEDAGSVDELRRSLGKS